MESAELSLALDDYLFRSPVPQPAPIPSGLPPGTRISAGAFVTEVIEQLIEADDTCPPLPFGRLGIETELTFVTKDAKSSEAAIRKLASAARSDAGEKVQAIVFDGATQDEINELQHSLPEGFIAIPDSDGVIAKRLGVRVWPSSLSINGNGIVTDIEPRVEANPDRLHEGEAS